MDEYIRRGAAIEQFEDSTSAIPEKLARIRIKSVPAADVAEVRHGRWEWIGGYGYQYRCSECVLCVPHKTNYCPNCGAKMDGGQDDV